MGVHSCKASTQGTSRQTPALGLKLQLMSAELAWRPRGPGLGGPTLPQKENRKHWPRTAAHALQLHSEFPTSQDPTQNPPNQASASLPITASLKQFLGRPPQEDPARTCRSCSKPERTRSKSEPPQLRPCRRLPSLRSLSDSSRGPPRRRGSSRKLRTGLGSSTPSCSRRGAYGQAGRHRPSSQRPAPCQALLSAPPPPTPGCRGGPAGCARIRQSSPSPHSSSRYSACAAPPTPGGDKMAQGCQKEPLTSYTGKTGQPEFPKDRRMTKGA